MNQLIYEYSECPYISLWAVYVVDNSLWRHVQRRADANILKVSSKSVNGYVATFANPKSAILALPLWMKILAALMSLCIT